MTSHLTHPFSAPYLSSLNNTTFEWYWFDLVSADTSTSLVVIFFTATPLAFPLLAGVIPTSSAVSVLVTARLPNGSVYFSGVAATEAMVASGGIFGQGAVGSWVGAEGYFAGTRDAAAWKVEVDTRALDPLNGIKASVVMRGRAPPHYPCSAHLGLGQKLEIAPHLGWANGVPDSDADGTIELVDGTVHGFGEGSLGYHDHNWGDVPFPETIRSWYWGHAHVGEWSVVFFDGLAADGQDFADAYVARGGKVVLVDCGPESVEVRETATLDLQSGGLPILDVNFDLPDGNVLALEVKAVSINALVDGVYERYVTSVTGSVDGSSNFTGVGMFEHFLHRQA